jgi:hypothetical protein
MVCLLAFQKNGLNDQKETSDLTEAVKQTLYEEYLQVYSERTNNETAA